MRYQRIVFALALAAGSAAGCAQSELKSHERSDSEFRFNWASRHIDTNNGCVLTERYAAPKVEGDICVADVLVESRCPDGKGVPSDNRVTYVGLLKQGSSKCTELTAGRDFFAQSVYGSDRFFIPLLKKVSFVLRRELVSPSADFKNLGDAITKELREMQMSAVSGIKFASDSRGEIDRYTVSFPLPKAKVTVILSLDEDGSDAEWGRLAP